MRAIFVKTALGVLTGAVAAGLIVAGLFLFARTSEVFVQALGNAPVSMANINPHFGDEPTASPVIDAADHEIAVGTFPYAKAVTLAVPPTPDNIELANAIGALFYRNWYPPLHYIDETLPPELAWDALDTKVAITFNPDGSVRDFKLIAQPVRQPAHDGAEIEVRSAERLVLRKPLLDHDQAITAANYAAWQRIEIDFNLWLVFPEVAASSPSQPWPSPADLEDTLPGFLRGLFGH